MTFYDEDGTVCDACGIAFDAIYDEGAILSAGECFCANCAEQIRRGKELLSDDQRSDLRRKTCEVCGAKLPIGRTVRKCKACSLDMMARYFGRAKAERMLADEWSRENSTALRA